jgi:hypothetical protein
MGDIHPSRHPSRERKDPPGPHYMWRCLYCGADLVDMGPGGAYCPEHDVVRMEWKAYETLLGKKHPHAPDKAEDTPR